MRKVEIGNEHGEKYPFVAIDRGSGQVLFRHSNREELETLCLKLRWDVINCVTARPGSANLGAAAEHRFRS